LSIKWRVRKETDRPTDITINPRSTLLATRHSPLATTMPPANREGSNAHGETLDRPDRTPDGAVAFSGPGRRLGGRRLGGRGQCGAVAGLAPAGPGCGPMSVRGAP